MAGGDHRRPGANDSPERDTAYHVRLLVDHVPSMLAYWDRDLLCRFANRAYERWFGVDPDGLVGTSIRDLLGPALFAANERYIRAALRGEQQVFERTVPGPDGVQRHSLATYVPDIEDGEVLGFIAHVTEVTQLKQTENALRDEIAKRERSGVLLRASERSLKEAQRLGQIGSWTWDAANDVTTWSEELYRIFGLDPALAPPTFAQHSSLYSEQSWQRLESVVAECLHSGAPYLLELEYRRADGGTGWLEARGERQSNGEPGDVWLRGTVQEVSQRRADEASRVRLQVLEAASRNKTALLSRVSHELRTPLNAILGFAQLCEADTVGDAAVHRRWAEHIVAAGRHMLELVNEVLDLSAADSGNLVLRSVDVELAAVCREALAQLSAVADDAGVRTVGPEPAQRAYVHGDPTRVRQVVDNLLSNAIKYTSSGGVVTLALRARGSMTELSVSDTGSGMSAPQLARLFQPFERLGAETSRIPGTGLGLALSKAMVERMGGVIDATSELDVGTTFTVLLPGPHGAAP